MATSTGFDGNTVTLDGYYGAIIPADIDLTGTATVTPGTTTFPSLAALSTGGAIVDGSLTVSNDTLTFLYPQSEGGVHFATGPVNTYVLTDTTPGAPIITGVTLGSTNISGLTESDLSFTGDSISLDVAGLTLPIGAPASIIISVSFGAAPPPNPTVTVPGVETVTAGTTAAFSGASISDPSAIGAADSLTLSLSASTGTISMTDAAGNAVAGSGTGTIELSGSLEQLNADLATLSYTAGSTAGPASITVNVVDQAGVGANGTIDVTVNAPPPINLSQLSNNVVVAATAVGEDLAGTAVSPTIGADSGTYVDDLGQFIAAIAGGDSGVYEFNTAIQDANEPPSVLLSAGQIGDIATIVGDFRNNSGNAALAAPLMDLISSATLGSPSTAQEIFTAITQTFTQQIAGITSENLNFVAQILAVPLTIAVEFGPDFEIANKIILPGVGAIGALADFFGDSYSLFQDASNGASSTKLVGDIQGIATAAFTLEVLAAVAAGTLVLPEALIATMLILELNKLNVRNHPATAWGDPHLTTFDGLLYDFQAVGEFTLAQSTLASDSYDVQVRLQPYGTSLSVSIITQVAAVVGSDRVTFDLTRPNTVWVDGSASTLSAANPIVALNGGFLLELSANQYLVFWNTGETLTVTKYGSYLGVSTQLAPDEGAGSVKGLLGSDSGTANDFQLANSTVLKQPLTTAQLYGEFGKAWRVIQATSLLDYGPGQTTATFTNLNFPGHAASLSDFSAAQVAQAAQLVAADGITDPNVAAAAELDYLETNDPSFLTGAGSASQNLPATTPAVIIPTALHPPPTISAVVPGTVEKSQTAVIGTVTPAVAGDTLTLVETEGAGTLSLGTPQANGTQQVIYTAPASIPASAVDTVNYSVTENGASVTSSASVQLDAGPSVTMQPFALAGANKPVTVAKATPGLSTDTLTLVVLLAPSSGTLALNGTSVQYTPATSTLSNSVSFSFEVKDQLGGLTAPTTVAVGGTSGNASGNTDIALGNGINRITVAGNGNVVDAGFGANTVTGSGNNNTIVLGAGIDSVTLNGSDETVTEGVGLDGVKISGGGNTVTEGTGVDTVTVGGSGNKITLGGGLDTVHGGTGDSITLNGNNAILTLYGTNEMVFLGGTGDSIDDLSKGMTLVLSGNPGNVTLSDLAKDPTGVIDLRGGLGGFTTTKAVLAALQSDRHGGALLSFGKAGSLDFLNVAPSHLAASQFTFV